MKSASAAYFDGRVSTRRAVALSVNAGMLIIRGEGVDKAYSLSDVKIPPRVGSVKATVRLPDGGVCEVDDADLLTELEEITVANRGFNLIHRWEKSLTLALAALAVTAVLVMLFIRYGVPVLSRHVAFALPPATEASIGRETLATLDRLLMKPSRLPAQRRQELTSLFRRVAGPGPEAAEYRVLFRFCPEVGANAFALPSGIVVVTDGLAELSHDNDEIGAIMAHELGHVRGRHVLRHVLQNSVTGLIVATLTGDLTSISSLAATLPTVLVDASFSRDFEREADDAAIAWMRASRINPRRYAEILGRLQAQLDARSGTAFDGKSKIRNYLSTHPDTTDRVRHILEAGGN